MKDLESILTLWNIWQEDIGKITSHWTEVKGELKKHGIEEPDKLVKMLNECDRNNNQSSAFGSHVLHKMGKAVLVVQLYEGENRASSMRSVAGDLIQMINYAEQTPANRRNVRDCLNFIIKKV